MAWWTAVLGALGNKKKTAPPPEPPKYAGPTPDSATANIDSGGGMPQEAIPPPAPVPDFRSMVTPPEGATEAPMQYQPGSSSVESTQDPYDTARLREQALRDLLARGGR